MLNKCWKCEPCRTGETMSLFEFILDMKTKKFQKKMCKWKEWSSFTLFLDRLARCQEPASVNIVKQSL